MLAPLSGLLETDPFTSSVTYDALNRPVSVTTPDHSVYRPTFNEANLLDRVDVNLRGATANGQPSWTPFVTNLNYNAKGQRALIAYANGATTTYTYDPATFRLTHLQTTRLPGNGLATQLFQHPGTVQNLQYTYDPAGNITHIADEALLGVVNNNQPVDPVCSYRYDALYRLIEATGREHIGQTAHDVNPQNRRDYDFVGLADFLAHLNDLQGPAQLHRTLRLRRRWELRRRAPQRQWRQLDPTLRLRRRQPPRARQAEQPVNQDNGG